MQASGAKSAVFDLSAAAELGRDGLLAAAEGICGGAYQRKYTLSDRWEPEFACTGLLLQILMSIWLHFSRGCFPLAL